MLSALQFAGATRATKTHAVSSDRRPWYRDDCCSAVVYVSCSCMQGNTLPAGIRPREHQPRIQAVFDLQPPSVYGARGYIVSPAMFLHDWVPFLRNMCRVRRTRTHPFSLPGPPATPTPIAGRKKNSARHASDIPVVRTMIKRFPVLSLVPRVTTRRTQHECGAPVCGGAGEKRYAQQAHR